MRVIVALVLSPLEDPVSDFSFQPVLHIWGNKSRVCLGLFCFVFYFSFSVFVVVVVFIVCLGYCVFVLCVCFVWGGGVL